MPIHRHLNSSESVTLLRGKICWHFYDDAGNKTESVILDANGDVRCINVEKGRWHSLECMESGSVLGKASEKWLAHALKHIGSTKPENLHRVTSKYGQVSHQNTAKCHIKIRPSVTSKSVKMTED